MLALKSREGVWFNLYDKRRRRRIGRIKVGPGLHEPKVYFDFDRSIIIHREDAKHKRFT